MEKQKNTRVGIGSVPKSLRDKFDKFCDAAGFVKGRVLEGALTMFMELPTDQQIELMKKANTKQSG